MTRILTGLVAAIVIAVGGFFGFQFYMQHRVAGEIEAAFEQIRGTGGKASHGKVSFDLTSRTVTVADIVSETAAQPPVSIRIASITVSGVNQPDAKRFSADGIDATDIEVGVAMASPPGLNLTYKMPHITVKDYSGPASLQRPPASSSFIDLYRFALEQFADITAASITAPSLAASVNFGAATLGGADFAYSGFAMQGIKNGKIDLMKVDGFVFTVDMQQAGKAEKITGNLANIAAYDVDFGAMAAIFDPQKASDDRYYRAYRQISAGPYILTSAQGMNMRIDGVTIDDVGLRPSRLQLPALLAMLSPAGAAPPRPAQAREIVEKVAQLYEGIRVGNAEMRDISMQTPEGPIKLSTIRLNFDGGKIGELAFEGLGAHTPKGPVKLERFALKSLDISGLMRMTAQFEPVALELGGLLKASARISLANVPRGVFSTSAAQATAMAAQIEAGTLEFTLRDMGGGDIAVAQYARSQNVSREAARRALVDNIRASGEKAAAANLDAAAAVEALAHFVETPGQTLIIKLTPLGKVPALQLIQVLQTDPLVALAQFRIEASTGL